MEFLATENETVDNIKEAINDAKFGKDNLEAVGRWIDSVRNGQGGRFADHTNDGREAGKSGKTYALDDGTSERNTEGNHESGYENTTGKPSRELDIEDPSFEERVDDETTQRMDGDSNIRYSLADTLTITDVTRMRFAVGIIIR